MVYRRRVDNKMSKRKMDKKTNRGEHGCSGRINS